MGIYPVEKTPSSLRLIGVRYGYINLLFSDETVPQVYRSRQYDVPGSGEFYWDEEYDGLPVNWIRP